MTVQELIDALQEIEDKTQRVVVRGYEGGVNDVYCLKETKIKLYYNDAWYYGKHEEVYREDAVSAIKLVGG